MAATLDEIATALGGKKSGAGYVCNCPAHEDKRASLSLSNGNKGVVFKCHAGCAQDAVLAALKARGLWNGAGKRSPCYHAKLGEPSAVYDYRNREGRIVFHVARYESVQGKAIRPWTLNASGECEAHAAPAPRPLYRLPQLLVDPARRALVVEGEKCADAAARVLGDRFALTAWSGGAESADKTDFSPLAGREVVLWPDADKAGYDAMQKLGRRLAGNGAGARIKVLDVGERPKGWDVADAIAEGWSVESLLTFIDERSQPFVSREREPTAPAKVDESAAVRTAGSGTRFPRIWLDDVQVDLTNTDLIKHLIGSKTVIVIYGPSGQGKTFFTIDLVSHIAGGKAWRGRRVRGCLVIYIAAEAGASIVKRFVAARDRDKP